MDAKDGRLDNWLIHGAILFDIVPTLMQWKGLADSKSATADFHLPFLANSSMATEMIKLYGGDRWCRERILKWAGQTSDGLQSLQRDGAIDLYSNYFQKESVIRASCEDYRSGANEDVDEQRKDQEANKKLTMDTLVAYSTAYLGSDNLEEIWKEFFNGPGRLRVKGIEGGIGHFIAEEAPEEVASLISSFYSEVYSKQ